MSSWSLSERDGSPVSPASPQASAPRAVPCEHRLEAVLAVIVAATLFGTTGTAQALGPSGATALGIGGVRLCVGAALLALVAARARGRRRWRAHWRALLVGGLGVAAYQLAWFLGLRRTGVALGTIVGIASCPVFAGALGGVLGREQLSRGWIAGTALAASGTAFLVARGPSAAHADALGFACMLGAGLSYAVYARAVKHAIEAGLDPAGVMAGVFTVGAVLLVPLAVREPLGWVLTVRGGALALHLGLVTIGVAYTLYGWALRRLSVATVATLTLAEPLAASLFAVTLLGERLDAVGWTGVLVVTLGLTLTGACSQP